MRERDGGEERLWGSFLGIRVTFRKGGNGNVWDNPHLDDILLTVGSRRKNVEEMECSPGLSQDTTGPSGAVLCCADRIYQLREMGGVNRLIGIVLIKKSLMYCI